MKKNLVWRLGVAALVVSIISISLVSGTFAKYTSMFTGTEQVRAAEFAFDLNDGTTLYSETQTSGAFNIFDYTDTGVFGDGLNVDEFIAPGTTGIFTLEVTNKSEVKIGVSFDLLETNAADIPVYYTIDGAPQKYSDVLTGAAYLPLSDLADALSALPASTLAATDGTTLPLPKATYTLNWYWSFETAGTEQTDVSDTTIGTTATLPTVKLDVATTVTQIDD